MQTIAKESHICRKEFKSQLSERGMSSQDPKAMDSQNTCDANHSNSYHNCLLVDECKLTEFNESRDEDNEEIIFHFSDEVIASEMKSKTKDIPNDRSLSPIEEFRTDGKDWQYFHTSTSTPTANKHVLPDLNISSINLEESDSDFLYERQISRFQITDEFINSSVFDDNEDKQNQ